MVNKDLEKETLVLIDYDVYILLFFVGCHYWRKIIKGNNAKEYKPHQAWLTLLHATRNYELLARRPVFFYPHLISQSTRQWTIGRRSDWSLDFWSNWQIHELCPWWPAIATKKSNHKYPTCTNLCAKSDPHLLKVNFAQAKQTHTNQKQI